MANQTSRARWRRRALAATASVGVTLTAAGSWAQADLYECYQQTCNGPDGQCNDLEHPAGLPGLCVMISMWGHLLPTECLQFEGYADHCTNIQAGSLRQAGAAGEGLDECLVEHCLGEGGQCTVPEAEQVVPGGCVLLDEEVKGKTYSLSPACAEHLYQGRPCAQIEAMAVPAAEKSESDGCSTRPGSTGGGQWALGLLMLVGLRRRRSA